MQPFSAIDHVQLAMPAGREDDARAFFLGVLGMTEVPKPPDLAKRAAAGFPAHPALRCADFLALLERLRSAGVAYEENSDAGTPRAFVHDPFCNRIELLWFAEAR